MLVPLTILIQLTYTSVEFIEFRPPVKFEAHEITSGSP